MALNSLGRFAASTRQKVNMELAERFDFAMRREGDKPIRLQMAKARRAATAVNNLLAEFKDILPTQIKELESSAKALRKLADDLEGLARFAKGYQAFYQAEIRREEDDELEALAMQRWGTDQAAVEFEWALIHELSTRDGRAELGQWMHGRGQHASVDTENFHSPFRQAYQMGSENKRRAAAKAVHQAQTSSDLHATLSYSGKDCHLGWRDYEAFLAERKAAASLVNNMVLNAKAGSQEE